MLIEYFKKNKIDKDVRKILSADFPEFYTWNFGWIEVLERKGEIKYASSQKNCSSSSR
jgi:hypothetical protein